MYRKEPFSQIKKKIGHVSKLDVWVPHQLTGAQLTHQISTCDLQKLLELNWDVLLHPPYSPD